MKCYNAMIDRIKYFNQPVINNIKIYENIRKSAIAQGEDCTSGCLQDYAYFKEYKSMAVDLSKEQALDADLRAIQQVNFTENLNLA